MFNDWPCAWRRGAGCDVTLTWDGAVVQSRQFGVGEAVVVGPHQPICLPGDAWSAKVLAVATGRGHVQLAVDDAALDGEICDGSHSYSFAAVRGAASPIACTNGTVVLPAGLFATIRLGAFEVEVRPRPADCPGPALWSPQTAQLARCLGLAVLVLAGTVGAAFWQTSPRDRRRPTYLEQLDEGAALLETQWVEPPEPDPPTPLACCTGTEPPCPICRGCCHWGDSGQICDAFIPICRDCGPILTASPRCPCPVGDEHCTCGRSTVDGQPDDSQMIALADTSPGAFLFRWPRLQVDGDLPEPLVRRVLQFHYAKLVALLGPKGACTEPCEVDFAAVVGDDGRVAGVKVLNVAGAVAEDLGPFVSEVGSLRFPTRPEGSRTKLRTSLTAGRR